VKTVEIEESIYGGTPLITVRGDVDHYSFADLAAATRALLDKGNTRLALDLRECPYMDSAGISVLLGALGRVQPQDGILAVITVNPDLLRTFEIVGLSKFESFRVLSSPDELAALPA
jgi:anti-anti-sigma factor